MVIYISGGVRSGKTRYAAELALDLSKKPIYVATAKIWDEDFAQRVQRHQADRGPEWSLIEQQRDLHLLDLEDQVAVIDCVTLWLTNLWMDNEQDPGLTLTAFRREMDLLMQKNAVLVIISNEIGMGVHPETEVGRKFADLQGWANQYVAKNAGKAIFMISGLPLLLK